MPSKGAVSYSNTHPFLSCRGEFALVHNGHSVNDGLAEILKKDGHRIMGDTDSEILCHQLESLYLEKGDMVDAINGLYDNKFSGAILVLMRDGTMYGVTSSFYPLYVLQSGREIYLASTSEAIAHRGTPRRLESWEIAEVKRGKLRIHKAIHKEEPTVWVKKDRIGKLWNLMNWYE
jgi:glucosamine 6-phosphate synthetase-like amidotransferase/phosphosugar isomerase protein